MTMTWRGEHRTTDPNVARHSSTSSNSKRYCNTILVVILVFHQLSIAGSSSTAAAAKVGVVQETRRSSTSGSMGMIQTNRARIWSGAAAKLCHHQPKRSLFVSPSSWFHPCFGIRGGSTSTIPQKSDTSSSLPSSTTATSPEAPTKARLEQVQIIHRHGDRTPITPIKKHADYWHSTLPQPQLLEQLSKGIRLQRMDTTNNDSDSSRKHGARGKPPFGQLTSLGLYQMVQLGSKLREELCCSTTTNTTTTIQQQHKLFTVDQPLHPKRIKARSTDFPRTIQSLQALLVGLFPDGFNNNSITSYPTDQATSTDTTDNDDVSHLQHFLEVDLRHSQFHIPDPQPRHTKLQERLELQAELRDHIQEKEKDMLPLAIKVTNDLLYHDYIHEHDAKQVSFGFNIATPTDSPVKQQQQQEEDTATFVLPWAQLAEVTKCLRVHNLLPPTITHEEQELILQHASWKWFETLQHSKLGKLAMHHMMTDLLQNILEHIRQQEATDDTNSTATTNATDSTLLHIYSAHDSTLIGLMCAFQLTQPAEWPEYASYLKIELISVEDGAIEEVPNTNDSTTNSLNNTPNTLQFSSINKTNKKYYVRFSLNGSLLYSKIGHSHDGSGKEDELMDMIPLEKFEEFVRDVSHLEDDEEIAKLNSTT